MSITDPKVQDAFLTRVRVELFAAAQVMKGERMETLRTLLDEVTSIIDPTNAAVHRTNEIDVAPAFAPRTEGELVYVSSAERAWTFVALYKPTDDKLHWFRVSNESTPHASQGG